MQKTASLPSRASSASAFTVALLPWGDVIEDYLEGIGVSLEAFCQEMTGGWLFGYIDALKREGIRTVVVCFSAHVAAPVSYTNRPTGATMWVVPASKGYLKLRKRMRDPYGGSVGKMFGKVRTGWRWMYRVLHAIGPYAVTPVRRLARILQGEKCDAMLCQEYETPRFDVCVLLGKWLRLPVFATFQGGTWQRGSLERLLRPWAMKACAGLIIASQEEVARVRAHYDLSDVPVAHIFNPLDLAGWHVRDRDQARAQLNVSPSAQCVVWHGRVDIHRKGLDVLLQAWSQVYEQRQSRLLSLLLIGTGDDADALRQRLRTMQGILWVDRFVLDRDTLRHYLAAADVYVFPSRHEGFPVAPIEAMACGLPVVAAAAPGVTDIFEAGEASGGLVVPCGDAEALARALGRVLDDAALRRAMGARGRARAEAAFSLAGVGAQLRAVFFPEDVASG